MVDNRAADDRFMSMALEEARAAAQRPGRGALDAYAEL